MHIRLSTSYYRALRGFIKGNKRNLENTQKALKLLKASPNHPSLHLEKLTGSKIWTIRVDKGNRIFFHFIDKNIALLVDIGKHDKYRRY